MKRTLFRTFYIVLFVCPFTFASSAQQLEWGINCGGLGNTRAKDMVLDEEKNIYVAGSFSGTVDLDPFGSYPLSFTTGVFLQKLDPTGDLVWLKHLSNSSNLELQSMARDSTGNFYLAGYFSGTVDFDPGPGEQWMSGSLSGFLVKWDHLGNFKWGVKLGSSSNRYSSITCDKEGSVYSTGWFAGTVDFDPGPGAELLVSEGGYDVFIQKLDSSGSFVWVRHIGSPGLDFASDVNIDKTNKLIAGGSIELPAIIGGTGDTLAGGLDFLLRMDLNGNLIWSRSIASRKGFSQANNRNEIDINGNIHIAGTFGDTLDFDPGPGVFTLAAHGVYNQDAVVLTLDSSGNFVHAFNIEGSTVNPDKYHFTAMDNEGNLYALGVFYDSVDIDPGPAETILFTEYNTMVLQKFNASGDMVWYGQMDGLTMTPTAFFLDENTSLYISGYFKTTMDFDPGPGEYYMNTSGDVYDEFVVKFNTQITGIPSNEVVNALSVYPNPTHGELSLGLDQNAGFAQVTVTDVRGRLVLQQTFSGTNAVIDLEGPAGMYFVSVQTSDQRSVTKVVKQ